MRRDGILGKGNGMCEVESSTKNGVGGTAQSGRRGRCSNKGLLGALCYRSSDEK